MFGVLGLMLLGFRVAWVQGFGFKLLGVVSVLEFMDFVFRVFWFRVFFVLGL